MRCDAALSKFSAGLLEPATRRGGWVVGNDSGWRSTGGLGLEGRAPRRGPGLRGRGRFHQMAISIHVDVDIVEGVMA